MRAHSSTLIPRMIRAGLRISHCRHRVIAAGIDYRGRIISIRTNTPWLQARGRHAEERVIYTCPKSLAHVFILRVGARGDLLPIDPCLTCVALADKRGVTIEPIR